MVNNNDSNLSHALKFLRSFLVEDAERLLNTVTRSESTRKRNFPLIADLLPVVSRHKNVGELAAIGVIDIQKHYHRLF